MLTVNLKIIAEICEIGLFLLHTYTDASITHTYIYFFYLFLVRWEQDPAVVNAFYNPNTNDIGKQSDVLVHVIIWVYMHYILIWRWRYGFLFDSVSRWNLAASVLQR